MVYTWALMLQLVKAQVDPIGVCGPPGSHAIQPTDSPKIEKALKQIAIPKP